VRGGRVSAAHRRAQDEQAWSAEVDSRHRGGSGCLDRNSVFISGALRFVPGNETPRLRHVGMVHSAVMRTACGKATGGAVSKAFEQMVVEPLTRYENIMARSEELWVSRGLLYIWRDQLDPVEQSEVRQRTCASRRFAKMPANRNAAWRRRFAVGAAPDGRGDGCAGPQFSRSPWSIGVGMLMTDHCLSCAGSASSRTDHLVIHA
jgi:hypothetical protein